MSLTEHQIQKAFFDWVRIAEKQHPELRLMVAIPNAAKRSYKLMAMLKAEGFRAGIPDVLFLVARRGFMGMAIEFKTPGNKPKQHQQEFIDMMKQEGWHVLVLTDPMLAIQEVKLYLGI